MNQNKTLTNGTGGKSPPRPSLPSDGQAKVAAIPPLPEKLPPDPEVVPKATRRRYSAEFKLRVLREADTCSKPGEIGALLRREGLYSSVLTLWRRERERGDLLALTPKKRGAKPTRDPRDVENERLKRELEKVQERLRIAELICEAQKKVAQILGLTLGTPEGEGRTSC